MPLEAFHKDLSESHVAEIFERIQRIIELDLVEHIDANLRTRRHADTGKHVIENGAADDADDHSRFDFQLGKNGNEQKRDDRNNRRDHGKTVRREI